MKKRIAILIGMIVIISCVAVTAAHADQTLTLNATNGSIGVTIISGSLVSPGVYTDGAELDLVPTADATYTFTVWTDDIAAGEEQDDPLRVVMSANKTVTANFVETSTLKTLTTAATNGSIAVTIISGVETSTGVYTDGAQLQLVPTADADYTFTAWSGDVSADEEDDDPLAVIMDVNKSITASFAATRTLVINASNGSVAVNIISGSEVLPGVYTLGAELDLVSTADATYTFTVWTDDIAAGEEQDDPLRVVMSANKTVTANFVETSTLKTLTTAATNGSIAVTIISGVETSTGVYTDGAQLQLVPTADADYTFTAWSGDVSADEEDDDPLAVIMDANKSITASFTTLHTLIVRTSSIAGTISSDVTPDFLDDTTSLGVLTYVMKFAHDSTFTLTATPQAEYTFSRWDGTLSGTGAVLTINNISMNMEIHAYFSKDDQVYEVAPGGTDDLSGVSGGAPFATIDYAINFLMPGNMLMVQQGAYSAFTVDNTVNGEIDNPITLIGSGNVIIDAGTDDQAALIEGGYIKVKGFKFINGLVSGLKITGDNVTIEECEAYNNSSGAAVGGFYADGASAAFIKCAAYNNEGTANGLYAANSDILIHNCIAHHNSGDGFKLDGGASLIIEESVSYNNALSGINAIDTGGCLLRQNIAMNNSLHGLSVSDTATLDNGTLYNNIAYLNSGIGFNVSTDGAVLINNISDDNAIADVAVDITAPASALRVNYNYWGDDGIVAGHDADSISDADSADGTPGFFDPTDFSVVENVSASNFGRCYGLRLKEAGQSICCDAGAPLARIATTDVKHTIDIEQANAARYFRIADQIRVENSDARTIIGISDNFISLDDQGGALVPLSVIAGDHVNPMRVYGVPDIGAYERTSYPTNWGFVLDDYKDSPRHYLVLGMAKIDDTHLQTGDWVGAFDEDGNCYGVGRYEVDDYEMSVFGDDLPNHAGFESDDKIYFKFYISGTGDTIPAVSDPLTRHGYLDPAGTDEVEINLVKAEEQVISLKDGWNFISLYLSPESTKIVDIFKDIYDAIVPADNKLEYVTELSGEYWYYDDGTVIGNLEEMNSFNSYYVRVNVSQPTTITIMGLKVLRAGNESYTFNLNAGWNSLSYLFTSGAFAFGNEESDIGIFEDMLLKLSAPIAWVKTTHDPQDGSWYMPGDQEDPYLQPGKGLFIKMNTSCTLKFYRSGTVVCDE